MSNFNPAEFISFILMILFSLSFHECAHGYVALKRGDDTAKLMGRLTLNPIAHIDLYSTIIVPIFCYFAFGFMMGAAKPVPVNPRNLKNPKNDMFWVALAGPASNIFLGVLAVAVIFILQRTITGFYMSKSAQGLLVGFVMINMFLAVFNMIPFHPLDGGKILERFLPAKANYFLEQNQQTIGIIITAIFVLSIVGIAPFNKVLDLIVLPAKILARMLLSVVLEIQ